MKKKTFTSVKNLVIKEFVWIIINVIFNEIFNYTSQYFAKQSQLISSAMEKHEISRMEFELVNNAQNILSNVQIFGNLIIFGIMIVIIIKYFIKH